MTRRVCGQAALRVALLVLTTPIKVNGDEHVPLTSQSLPTDSSFGSLLLSGAHAPPGPKDGHLHRFSTQSYPFARCLDGTASGVYITPPSNSSTSWFVLLDGGGLCTHESDCTSRAKTKLGSSSDWSDTFNFDQYAFFTQDDRNPFRDWGHAFVPYCGGDMHAGQRTTATNETFGLYFSGFHTVMAAVGYLSSAYGLNSTGATLVWSGGSAGGVGVFSTVDHVAAALPAVRVVGAPVAGFPPPIHWYLGAGALPPSEDVRTPAFKQNVALFDSVLPPRCVAALGPRGYECQVPSIAYSYLSTPLFMMQSLTVRAACAHAHARALMQATRLRPCMRPCSCTPTCTRIRRITCLCMSRMPTHM